MARQFCNLNVPVATRFHIRSLFHRDDALGIPTDNLIFDKVAQDKKQSVARILVCHVAGCEGATMELNVGRIFRVEMIVWKMPWRRIQHHTSERKRAVSIARHTGATLRRSETISIAKLHLCWTEMATSLFIIIIFFKRFPAQIPINAPSKLKRQRNTHTYTH